MRLWLEGQLVIDDWMEHGLFRNHTAPVALAAGRKYNLQLDYAQARGNASVKLLWQKDGAAEQTIPAAQLSPAAIPLKPAGPLDKRVYLSSLPFFAETMGWVRWSGTGRTAARPKAMARA